MLVLDAGAAIQAALSRRGFSFYDHQELVAPPLFWPECRSVLHLMAWRAGLSRAVAWETLGRLRRAPIGIEDDAALGQLVWTMADELGWGRTYDVEYLALARLRRCRLVTIDLRLRRGADHTGLVITPGEL